MDYTDMANAVAQAGDLAITAVNYSKAQKNAEENLNLAKDNLEYQKRLQNTLFEREDNAVQRRVADLKAAGLSPVLAAGSGAGAGQAVSTVAPYRDTPVLNAGLSEKIRNIYDLKSVRESIKNQKEQNNVLSEQGELLSAQKAYYRAQALKVMQEKTNLETSNSQQEFALDVDKQKFDDYIYNRNFDVESGKKIKDDNSLWGSIESAGNRLDTIRKKAGNGLKKGLSETGKFLKRTAENVFGGD